MNPIDRDISVIHNREKHRFEVVLEGQTAVSEYISLPDRIIFTHTEVPKGLEGRGIGNALAHTGLQYAKDSQIHVVPLCPYVAGYIARHPEWKEIVAPGFNVG